MANILARTASGAFAAILRAVASARVGAAGSRAAKDKTHPQSPLQETRTLVWTPNYRNQITTGLVDLSP